MIFLAQFLWLEYLVLCWTWVMRVGILPLFQILEIFKFFIIENVNYGLFTYDLCYFNISSFYNLLREFFSWKILIFATSSVSVEMIIWFLFFMLLMYHLINWWMLNHPCIPGINSTWLWNLIQYANVLLTNYWWKTY